MIASRPISHNVWMLVVFWFMPRARYNHDEYIIITAIIVTSTIADTTFSSNRLWISYSRNISIADQCDCEGKIL